MLSPLVAVRRRLKGSYIVVYMIFICNISLHIVEYQLDAFEFIATLLQDVQQHVFLQVYSCNRSGMRTCGTPFQQEFA